jgi:hypothetical protein
MIYIRPDGGAEVPVERWQARAIRLAQRKRQQQADRDANKAGRAVRAAIKARERITSARTSGGRR